MDLLLFLGFQKRGLFMGLAKFTCPIIEGEGNLSEKFLKFYTLGGIMKESKFQSRLIKKLKIIFPGCIIMKTDPSYMQGLPDLLILFGDKWAALECKRSKNAHHQPNQDYYVKLMNQMSFASFISPENEQEVLDEIQRALQPKRQARISKSKSASVVALRPRKVS